MYMYLAIKPCVYIVAITTNDYLLTIITKNPTQNLISNLNSYKFWGSIQYPPKGTFYYVERICQSI